MRPACQTFKEELINSLRAAEELAESTEDVTSKQEEDDRSRPLKPLTKRLAEARQWLMP